MNLLWETPPKARPIGRFRKCQIQMAINGKPVPPIEPSIATNG